MHTTIQSGCTCANCPGAGCNCGCQQACAASCGCGAQCQCGSQCQCGPQCGAAASTAQA